MKTSLPATFLAEDPLIRISTNKNDATLSFNFNLL